MSKKRDRALGMDRTITRRDFLNGCAVTVGASLAASSPAWLEAMASTRGRSRKRSRLLPSGQDRHARQPRRILGSGARNARRPDLGGRRR